MRSARAESRDMVHRLDIGFEWDVSKQLDLTSGPFGPDQRIEFKQILQFLPVMGELVPSTMRACEESSTLVMDSTSTNEKRHDNRSWSCFERILRYHVEVGDIWPAEL